MNPFEGRDRRVVRLEEGRDGREVRVEGGGGDKRDLRAAEGVAVTGREGALREEAGGECRVSGCFVQP